jgi:hypothetical protein
MFFTACALTSINSSPAAASRTCQIGFQYTPVASIATWVTPSPTSQSRSSRNEAVNVRNRRTVETRSPSAPGVRTQAITVFLCTSNPAHRETITSIATDTSLTRRSRHFQDRPRSQATTESETRARSDNPGCLTTPLPV